MRGGLLRWTTLAACLGVASLACGLAGCGGVTSPSARRSAATATPARVGAPTCAASQLVLTAAPEGAASGHIATLFHFTNTSRAACSLRGYPSARLLDASGKPLSIMVEQVAHAYLWKTTPVKTITLAAGGSAWFRAQTSNVTIQSGVTCPVAAQTIISPPGSAAGFTSSIHLSTCDGKVYLSPLVADPNDL